MTPVRWPRFHENDLMNRMASRTAPAVTVTLVYSRLWLRLTIVTLAYRKEIHNGFGDRNSLPFPRGVGNALLNRHPAVRGRARGILRGTEDRHQRQRLGARRHARAS